MNAVRKAHDEGRPALGCWCSMATPLSVELLAEAGFPWLAVDLQHGVATWDVLLPIVQAAKAGGADVVVRVPWSDPAGIMRALDLGAAGVIVPMVESGEEAAACAAALRYPPEGIRSFGPTRAARPTAAANEDVFCLPMVETRAGLERLEEIVAAPGVDGVFVGPVDLALSLGHGIGPHPEVDAAIDRAVELARERGRFVGTVAASVDEAAGLVARGVGFISVGADKAYLRAAAARDVEAIAAIGE